MFIVEAVCSLLQPCSYLIILLLVVLGVSAALLAAPLNNCKRSCEAEEEEEEEEGIPNRMQRDEPTMNTSSDDTAVQEIMKTSAQVQIMQVKSQDKKEPLNGLKPVRAQVSSSSPLWFRSLSLGPARRRVDPNTGNEAGGGRKKVQDSNPGPAPPKEKSVQRKPSLTGEEVKVLADALIARVHQRMRAQRQDSLKLRPESTSYKPPPLP